MSLSSAKALQEVNFNNYAVTLNFLCCHNERRYMLYCCKLCKPLSIISLTLQLLEIQVLRKAILFVFARVPRIWWLKKIWNAVTSLVARTVLQIVNFFWRRDSIFCTLHAWVMNFLEVPFKVTGGR